MPNKFLYVGLDYDDPKQAVDFGKEISDVPRNNFGLKLNQDFLFNAKERVPEVVALGKPVFADLKMWNGPRTMSSTARELAKMGVSHINIYAHAGPDFLKRTIGNIAEVNPNTQVLGITVLTHYDNAYCQRLYSCSLREAVKRLADIVYEGGCHGVILPGTTLDVIKDMPIKRLVPAARPRWYGKTGENDQEHESYIDDAIKGGADILVCSSPIRKSPDRRTALIKTLDEIAAAGTPLRTK